MSRNINLNIHSPRQSAPIDKTGKKKEIDKERGEIKGKVVTKENKIKMVKPVPTRVPVPVSYKPKPKEVKVVKRPIYRPVAVNRKKSPPTSINKAHNLMRRLINDIRKDWEWNRVVTQNLGLWLGEYSQDNKQLDALRRRKKLLTTDQAIREISEAVKLIKHGFRDRPMPAHIRDRLDQLQCTNHDVRGQIVSIIQNVRQDSRLNRIVTNNLGRWLGSWSIENARLDEIGTWERGSFLATSRRDANETIELLEHGFYDRPMPARLCVQLANLERLYHSMDRDAGIFSEQYQASRNYDTYFRVRHLIKKIRLTPKWNAMVTYALGEWFGTNSIHNLRLNHLAKRTKLLSSFEAGTKAREALYLVAHAFRGDKFKMPTEIREEVSKLKRRLY